MANIVGTNGNDALLGTDDADTISGLGGNDTLEGLRGDDALDGGPGRDTAVYRNLESTGGVDADLVLGRGAPFEGDDTDTFTSIEDLEGSAQDDRLIGDDNVNFIRGFGGNDRIEGLGADDRLEGGSGRDSLEGGAGNDRLDGGIGSDFATYSSSTSGIRANLATGTVRDGFGTTDTLVSIEEVGGSVFDDRLTGGPDANRFDAGSGNDRIDAGAGDDFLSGDDDGDILNGGGGDDVIFGDFQLEEDFAGSDTIRGGSGNDFINPGLGSDIVDGGSGTDTVIYDTFENTPDPSVFVDLETGIGIDFFGTPDTLVSVENVIGFFEGDTLFGDSRGNELSGRAGTDTIDGRGGADTLVGGADNDTLDGGVDRARDVFIYNFDAETPSGNDGSDVIRNLDVEEDALRLVSGLTDSFVVDPLIAVEDDGTDTMLRFVDGGAAITLIGVAGPDGPFDSVSDLVDNDIVFLV